MQIEDSKPRWGVLLILILFLGGLAALPFIFFRPKNLPPFEIQNFIGSVEIYSGETGGWVPPRRGIFLSARDKIRTGSGGEIDIRVPDQIRIRIKENSEVELRQSNFLDRALRYRLHLLKGTLLGATEKEFEGEQLEISTPVLVAAVRGTTFQVEADPNGKESSVRVLRGSVLVRAVKARKSVVVHALQMTEVKGNAAPLEPMRVTREEWDKMKEAYELIQKSALLEARQLDLSKEGGTIFQYVFDHGTFYTPKFGYSEREFVKDETTGKTRLEIEYDVFPVGSFVGMYTKTRNFDLSQFRGLEFQVRGDPEEGTPESFRIELKSGSGVVRLLVPRDLKGSWQTFQFPLQFNRPTPISEVTFVLSNEKVGSHKKGILYLQEINLLPLDRTPKASPPADTTQRS